MMAGGPFFGRQKSASQSAIVARFASAFYTRFDELT
jgi:hypothetical protein